LHSITIHAVRILENTVLTTYGGKYQTLNYKYSGHKYEYEYKYFETVGLLEY